MVKKKAEKKEQTLENILFNCRNALRGAGGTEKNRDAVIGLVFIKFASDKFDKRREEIKEQYGDVPAFLEKKSFYLADNVFYLEPHCRWSYLVKEASSNDIAVKIDTAMADIEKDNPPLQGALLSNFYTNLGADIRTLKNLIDEINKIDPKKFQEEDLIGRVYEYFLQSYAVTSSKEDGEFYTPACAVELISELIEPYSGTVYDPCCGSGGMFVQSMKFVERHHGNKLKISIVGQEKNPDTRRLAKMNLAIRGISYDLGSKPFGESSTFTDDQHKDRKVDFIMANPPFNLKDWRGENELLTDARWSGYEFPPKSNANYAWILHMLSKLDVTNGVAGFLLANGTLNADGTEYEIRKKLLENDKIEAIIVLPRDMFYTTDISVTLWIMNNNKKARDLNGRKLRDRQKEVLFCDLRSWDDQIEQYVVEKGKKKKKTVLTDEQIAKVKNIYQSWQTGDGYEDVPELCKSATLADIKKANYSLAPSKYVEFINHDLEIDYDKEIVKILDKMQQALEEEKKTVSILEDAIMEVNQ
ncbi:type I restriction-modification system subunit M [Bacillus toyonensis]|uniref:site-specific DNA-methyltransferase (adenine-specific) n=1 Tax=Bacillus toyonensis TaxID=155322 RepID=A0AB36SP39_9BACI|nr:class I SAM-dependent DNA methyltransferase [Bacillus toyonensis]PEK15724.1 restriction endonuclease subunit M [Bacillus toyonensis]PEN55859.1 restriction endonuclease subunit M [Bacillus toyonensis]PGC83588.1 restriction endonuclease subunit M [Bacillus toyonensis]PHA11260.1 restriction endonuclease subunit M [Bacillus toyonensis]